MRSLPIRASRRSTTRRPEDRAWEEWAVQTGPVVRTVAGVGEVERRREVTRVTLPYVSFRYTYRFASNRAELRSDSTLRFRSRAEVEETLTTNGFTILDVRDAPDRPGREYAEFGLSPDDAELARDRAFGGLDRAATGNPENCPDPVKDPLAWESFHRGIQDPSLVARIYPQLGHHSSPGAVASFASSSARSGLIPHCSTCRDEAAPRGLDRHRSHEDEW